MSSIQAVFSGGFDASAVEPQAQRSNEPLPNGAYDVEITDAKVKPTKSGNGTGMTVEFTVMSPERHANRKVFQYINLVNSNAQAEQIGQSQLSALCRAVNVMKLTDSDQLFQKTLRIQVSTKPGSGDYGPSNTVTSYESLGAGTASLPAAANSAAPVSAGASKPWATKRA